MNDLPFARVGSSELRVTSIGFGGAPIVDTKPDISDEQAYATVQAALDSGIRLFDTAPLYGAGRSERRLGHALRAAPTDGVVVASKVGRLVRPDGSVVFDMSRDGALRSLEASLERTGLDRIDIVHIHDPDEHYRAALDEVFPALAELRAAGTIGAIGAGMNQWQMLADFARNADFDCFLLAGRYTLLEQGGLPLLDLCRQRNIAVFLGGVYNSGILATGPGRSPRYNYAAAPPAIVERVRRIEALCRSFGVPLHRAATHFPRAHPAVASLLLGARTPDEVRANLAALAEPVPAELWAALRQAGLLQPDAPIPIHQ